MTSANRSDDVEGAHSGQAPLYRLSGTAALLAAGLLLAAVVELIATGVATNASGGYIAPFLENWLVVIFGLHAGVSGISINELQTLNFIDLGILALVAITHVGLYMVLHRTSRIWSIIALAQPFLGMALFVATKSAGRSAVMGAGLVASALMLRGGIFSKAIGWAGLLASALLLAGDLSAGAIPPSGIVATVFGLGYALLIAWLFAVGGKLIQAGSLEGEGREQG